MKKGLFFIVILLLLFIGLRKLSASFFSVKKYQCIAPKNISFHYFSLINDILSTMIAKNNTAQEIIDSIKKQFPVINTITITYKPSLVHVALSLYKPVCCINDTMVLTYHNVLVPKVFFLESSIKDLPHIVVNEENITTSSCLILSLLSTLSSGFSALYDLQFINECDVRLVDKQEPRFTIVFSVEQNNLSSLFTQCELVKANIIERSGFAKGTKWIADVRFVDYIVAYKI